MLHLDSDQKDDIQLIYNEAKSFNEVYSPDLASQACAQAILFEQKFDIHNMEDLGSHWSKGWSKGWSNHSGEITESWYSGVINFLCFN